MSTTSPTTLPLDRAGVGGQRLADFIELTKPRIATLVLITVGAAGYLASWAQPNLWLLANAMLGTALVAASASAMNHWLERRLDAQMPRTQRRPLASGRLKVGQAAPFAAATLGLGLLQLILVTGWIPASWATLTWISYVCVYTPLKTRTSANTAIGAVAGALPVLIGWTACGGTLDLRAATLFMIVYLWQFPHFMAIAWVYRRQYAGAGFRMLTVTDPSGRRAGVQAVLAALALVAVSLLPALLTPAVWGGAYAAIAFLLGVVQLACAIRFCLQCNDQTARTLLRATLLYLPLLMLLLVLVPLF